MRVFISQPMGGRTQEEILAERNEAIALLTKLGHEPVSAFFDEETCKKMTQDGVVQNPLWFLAKSIEIMSQCDAIYLCKGWTEAKGCFIEYQAAMRYGLKWVWPSGKIKDGKEFFGIET